MGAGFHCFLGLFWVFLNEYLTTKVLRKTLKCSSENPNQRAILCQTGICRWVQLLVCTKPQIASRGFLISASGRAMPGRLERGQEEGRGLPGRREALKCDPEQNRGGNRGGGRLGQAAGCSGCGGWEGKARVGGQGAPRGGDSGAGSWVLARQVATSSWGKPVVILTAGLT